MRLAELVTAGYQAFDVPAAMADVHALAEHDRYQAAAGIAAAADYVAERAVEAGLADVTVLRFPADGAVRWWTFAGPVAWTPRRASVRVGDTALVSYPEQPYALAAYSAGTPDGGRTTPVVRRSAGRTDLAGALVVLDDGVPLPAVVDELTGRGAAGVVADPLAGRVDRWAGQVGRLELPARCQLFAFSVTADQLAALGRAADAGTAAQVDVELAVNGAGGGTFPVVTGLLPASAGTGDGGELLLSAHLCHPRPSANDNASGVAALLGAARALAGGTAMASPVRFVWGPEFVGLAAYLHDVVHAGRAPVPVGAVNVDMAGQDQRRCGGPLIIERSPDELPSPLPAVAERCVTLLPPAARSYSGAVPCDTWTWRSTPYVGASDHAMLAGRPTSCPAIGLGHWPDRANHTSADTVDLVDPAELRRTATVAATTVAVLAAAGADAELAADLAETTVGWAATHVLTTLRGSARCDPGVRGCPPMAQPPIGLAECHIAPTTVDPWAPELAAQRLDHRAAVAADAVRSLCAVGVPDQEVELAVAWIDGLAEHARWRLPTTPAEPSRPATGTGAATVLTPRWSGPINLRALVDAATPADREWLVRASAEDRGGRYARMLALARGLDGRRDRDQVTVWAALASELPIRADFAERFLGLICRAGWASAGTGAGAEGDG